MPFFPHQIKKGFLVFLGSVPVGLWHIWVEVAGEQLDVAWESRPEVARKQITGAASSSCT